MQAEQDLRQAHVVMAATGNMKKGQGEKFLKKLRRLAGGRKRGTRPKTAADWAALGMNVTYEPRKEKAS